MRRLILAFFLLATGTGAWAQAYDPQVAYVRSGGSSPAIVLANLDGSKAVTVYTAPSKTALANLDFKPGGGRIAFVQGFSLRVLDYEATNAGIKVKGVTTLVTGPVTGLDFSPDGSTILYVCDLSGPVPGSAVCVVSADGQGQPQTVLQPTTPYYKSSVTAVRWNRSGTGFYYARNFEQDLRTEIGHVALINMQDNVLFTVPYPQEVAALDTARTTDALLFRLGLRIMKYDVSSGQFDDLVGGRDGHFTSDDSKIVLRPLNSASGDAYVSIFDIASGTTTNLTKKGNYGATDARP